MTRLIHRKMLNMTYASIQLTKKRLKSSVLDSLPNLATCLYLIYANI
jgi:hypothetical protein